MCPIFYKENNFLFLFVFIFVFDILRASTLVASFGEFFVSLSRREKENKKEREKK